MISKSFFKSSLIYSFVGSLPYASGIILIPFFTNYLTPGQFGVNALYISIMYLFQVLAGFGMDTFIGVYYYDYKDKREKLRELLGTVLLFSLIIGSFIIIVTALAGPAVFRLLWSKTDGIQFYPFGMLTVLSALFNAIFKAYTGLLINQQRSLRFFWMSMLNFLLTIAVSLILLFAFPFTLYGPVLGRFIPVLLLSVLSLIMMYREFGYSVRTELVQPLLSFCIPVFVYSILVWIVNYIDRFIITHFLPDTTYVGIFDIAVKITMFIDLIQIGLANTINPKVFAIWKDNDLRESTVEVNRYYNGFTALTLLIIPLLVIIMPLIIPLVINKPIYYQVFAFLPILSLGYATRGWFYMFIGPIYFFKKTSVLPKVFLFSAIFQIVISTILIRYYGLTGAVWANFLVKPVQAFFLYWESRKFFHFKFNRWKIFYLPVIFILVVVISEWLVNEYNRSYIHFGQFLTSVLLVWFAYRREIIPLISKRFLFTNTSS